jgi:FkbM family methyltransferase
MAFLMNFDQLVKKYQLDVKGVIHIGAHYGDEVPDYVNCGIQDITLFEPLSENFDILQKNMMGLNANIDAHQVALGKEEKTATMYLSSNETQSSSILKPKEHINQYPYITFERTEEVEVKTLDSFNIQNANFINIDVQGYELEVFSGGKETLKRIDYIHSEVNRDEMYENNAFIADLDNFLAEYGFERVETYWPDETKVGWGDAFYIKNKEGK